MMKIRDFIFNFWSRALRLRGSLLARVFFAAVTWWKAEGQQVGERIEFTLITSPLS